eukprot:gene12286-biopygen14184
MAAESMQQMLDLLANECQPDQGPLPLPDCWGFAAAPTLNTLLLRQSKRQQPQRDADALEQPDDAYVAVMESSHSFLSNHCVDAMADAYQLSQLCTGLTGSLMGGHLPDAAAVQAAQQHIRQKIDEVWSHEAVCRGVAHAKSGEYQQALSCYDKALELNPSNTDAMVARGAAYANKNHFVAAVQDFEAALSLDPSNANAKKYLQATRRCMIPAVTEPVTALTGTPRPVIEDGRQQRVEGQRDEGLVSAAAHAGRAPSASESNRGQQQSQQDDQQRERQEQQQQGRQEAGTASGSRVAVPELHASTSTRYQAGCEHRSSQRRGSPSRSRSSESSSSESRSSRSRSRSRGRKRNRSRSMTSLGSSDLEGGVAGRKRAPPRQELQQSERPSVADIQQAIQLLRSSKHGSSIKQKKGASGNTKGDGDSTLLKRTWLSSRGEMQQALHAEKLGKLVTLASEGKWQQVLDLSGKYKATAAAAQDISADCTGTLLQTSDHVTKIVPAQTQHSCPEADELQLQQLLQQQLEAKLSFSTVKTLALMRLRRYSQASLELQQLGHLPQQQLAGSKRCSMPFGLLYLRALLPSHLGDADLSLDLLYELQSYCRKQLSDAQCAHQQEPLAQALGSKCRRPEQQWQQQQQQQQHLLPGESIADAAPGGGDQPPKQLKFQESLMQLKQHQSCHPDQNALSSHNLPMAAAPLQAAPEIEQLWHLRWRGVTCQLISHHWSHNSAVAAFVQLELLLADAPTDVVLWSLAGRMQLQLHLTAAAHTSFRRAQQLVQQQVLPQQQQQWWQQQPRQVGLHQQADVSSSCSNVGVVAGDSTAPSTSTPAVELGLLQQLAQLNWGCYHALADNMEAAAAAFASLQHVPKGPEPSPEVNSYSNLASAAAANSAVCLMYNSQLTEAISAVEAGLHEQKPLLLQECTLRNLGILYDLAYPAASGRQARHSMASRLLRHVSDDFDLSCIEPQQHI